MWQIELDTKTQAMRIVEARDVGRDDKVNVGDGGRRVTFSTIPYAKQYNKERVVLIVKQPHVPSLFCVLMSPGPHPFQASRYIAIHRNGKHRSATMIINEGWNFWDE